MLISSIANRVKTQRGFTLAELLLAGALSATFFTAAAIAYQAITYNGKHYQSLSKLTIDPPAGTPLAGALANFYPLFSGTVIDAYTAPSYGRAAAAATVYDRFWEDVEKASAVFCLSRNGNLNSTAIRPTAITIPSSVRGVEIDTPANFQSLVLEPGFVDASSIYTAFRNVSPIASSVHMGGTVFILQPYDQADEVSVRAIYEIDLLEISSPAGVYASVRRYVGTVLSDYYDVFYHEASVADFGPIFVVFERDGRSTFSETSTDPHGVTIDAYKRAKRHPFFFMWWPDPSMMLGKDGKDLDADSVPSGDVRSGYFRMTARSGLMFTVPLFPPH